MSYEYRVIPAPVKGTKAKGAKTAQDRFALTLQEVMNTMGADGWEFQRAEALPSEERSGLTGTKLVPHNMLVFRRARAGGVADFSPKLMTHAVAAAPAHMPAQTSDTPEPAATLSAQRNDPAATTPRVSLFAKSDPVGMAPPVPSPQALAGTLSKAGSDTSRG